MAFSYIPVVAGDPIEAASFKDAFDKVQNYINTGIDVSDIVGHFNKHHIMKGSYTPIGNVSSFVTGICGGQSFTTIQEKLSWLAGTTTAPINAILLDVDFK